MVGTLQKKMELLGLEPEERAFDYRIFYSPLLLI